MFLFGGVGEDDRAVLGAYVRTLTIYLGWIVHLEETLQKRLELHPGGIVGHVHDFGMASRTRTDVFIRRVVGLAARVANRNVRHAGDRAECCFNAPEAARSEGRRLCTHADKDPFIQSGVARAEAYRNPSCGISTGCKGIEKAQGSSLKRAERRLPPQSVTACGTASTV